MEVIVSENNRQTSSPSNGIALEAGNPPVTLAAAQRYCRQLATSHYENFVVASVFLPKPMRQPFYNIYAYCRSADDLADLSPSPAVATEKLLAWRRHLIDCFSGHATHPVFVALRDTIRQFDLNIQPFDDLLDAFLQDQRQTRYSTFDELLAYCRRSADPVGRMMLRIAGADNDRQNLTWSDSICTGLQLANHWQDVMRDLQTGRIYLPKEDADRFGVDLDRLTCDRQRGDFCKLIHFECARARHCLRAGLPLLNRVPRWLAKDLNLIVHGGFATLDAIAKLDGDVLKRRPKVTRMQQMRLLVAAAFNRLES
ncbi:MAG: squalene synthase HpnC [Planctomycetaceae bacterium]